MEEDTFSKKFYCSSSSQKTTCYVHDFVCGFVLQNLQKVYNFVATKNLLLDLVYNNCFKLLFNLLDTKFYYWCNLSFKSEIQVQLLYFH